MPGNPRHGRNGFLYASIGSGGSAEPLYFLSKWGFGRSTDRVEVTSFGDQNKKYVSGLPDSTLSFSGFWDDSFNDLYTAANDGVARKFYLYPDKQNKPNSYFFGTMFFDINYEGAVDGAVGVSGSGSAASDISRNVG